jgi:hypothetical protein
MVAVSPAVIAKVLASLCDARGGAEQSAGEQQAASVDGERHASQACYAGAQEETR